VSSVSEEISNNSVNGSYDPHKADQKASVKRINSKYQGKKINEDIHLQEYIIDKLKRKWNPDEISGRMKKNKKPFYASKTSIYEWLYSVYGQRYCKYLYSKRYTKEKREEKKPERYIIPNRIGIEMRPKHINKRKQCGHTEADTIVLGKKGKGAISVLVERACRYIDATKLYTMKPLESALAVNTMMQNKQVRSTTMDNGIENRYHELLSVPAYFCDPYSSWQKGAVENANKMIRGYIPKGTNISKVSEQKIKHIINMMNNKPRKILNYAEGNFEAIYLRSPDRANPTDDAAVVVMAYGLRPRGRNLDSEAAAIKIYTDIFNRGPVSATTWDAVRAIAYSGATR
jgi:IS30 family transposase